MTVEEAKSMQTELDVVEGMQFDRGYVSPYFITNAEKMIAKLDQAYNWARAPAAIEEVANAHPISPVRGHSPATENVMLPTPAR